MNAIREYSISRNQESYSIKSNWSVDVMIVVVAFVDGDQKFSRKIDFSSDDLISPYKISSDNFDLGIWTPDKYKSRFH